MPELTHSHINHLWLPQRNNCAARLIAFSMLHARQERRSHLWFCVTSIDFEQKTRVDPRKRTSTIKCIQRCSTPLFDCLVNLKSHTIKSGPISIFKLHLFTLSHFSRRLISFFPSSRLPQAASERRKLFPHSPICSA